MDDRRDTTHRKMIEAAGRQFREHGFAGIGVAGVAKAAGVTSGAFYDHFGSKSGAFEAALVAGLDEVIAAIPQFRQAHGDDWLAAFTDYYLGRGHREDGQRLCVMTSLSADVARSSPALKKIYEAKMSEIAGLIAQGLAAGDGAQRLEHAWQILSALIGGLTLARASASQAQSDSIAAAVRKNVLDVAMGR